MTHPHDLWRDAAALLTNWWRWRHATSYRHLTHLAAADSAAREANLPAGPTRQVLNAVTALNQCGALTMAATPGTPTGGLLEQRAAVCVLADDRVKQWLAHVASDGGYGFIAFPVLPKGAPASAGVVVVRNPCTATCPGEPLQYLGDQMTARQIRQRFPVRPRVARDLYDRWQITVFDRSWSSDRLFDHLTQAAAAHLLTQPAPDETYAASWRRTAGGVR